jgi:pyridoxamine 5'-phosphate oxidase
MSSVDPPILDTHPVLRESDVDPDPLAQFRAWFEEARTAGLPQPEAMTLATATVDGEPSARMVLLRGFDERGFVFFTNFDSRKGRELTTNPRAALVFYWAAQDRQVRVEGGVEAVSAEESDAYFASRPRGSRLGAWASPQSQVIPGRKFLEAHMRQLEIRYAKGEIPRPPHWGGWRVVPAVIEFWQGQPNRLHDRLCYRRRPEGWSLERLAP